MHNDTWDLLLKDIFDDDFYVEDIDHHLEQYLFRKKNYVQLESNENI